MQTQKPATFLVGDEVSYGLHGKCMVTSIETKSLGGENVSFYQIRVLKNTLNPKAVFKGDPAILVPVTSAAEKGLRHLATKEQAETIMTLLSEPDYHFELKQTWVTKQKTLEEAIRKEGCIGLAKVVGHLYVLIKNDAVPPTVMVKFYDSVYKIFLRELSDALQMAAKELEPLITKALKQKLNADH